MAFEDARWQRQPQEVRKSEVDGNGQQDGHNGIAGGPLAMKRVSGQPKLDAGRNHKSGPLEQCQIQQQRQPEIAK
jgi:hypothetical protein